MYLDLLKKIPSFAFTFFFLFFRITTLCVSRRGIAFIVENRYSTAGSRMETYTERVKRYVRDGLRLKKRNETRREREGGGEEEEGEREGEERTIEDYSKWFIKRSRRNRERRTRECVVTSLTIDLRSVQHSVQQRKKRKLVPFDRGREREKDGEKRTDWGEGTSLPVH